MLPFEAGFRSVGGFSGGIFIAQFGQASFFAGNFFQAKAQEAAGVFVTQYCCPRRRFSALGSHPVGII